VRGAGRRLQVCMPAPLCVRGRWRRQEPRQARALERARPSRTQAFEDKSLCQPAGAAWTRLERGAGRQRERPLQRGRECERLAERGRVAAAHAHGRLAQRQARRDDQRQLSRADARAGRVLGRRAAARRPRGRRGAQSRPPACLRSLRAARHVRPAYCETGAASEGASPSGPARIGSTWSMRISRCEVCICMPQHAGLHLHAPMHSIATGQRRWSAGAHVYTPGVRPRRCASARNVPPPAAANASGAPASALPPRETVPETVTPSGAAPPMTSVARSSSAPCAAASGVTQPALVTTHTDVYEHSVQQTRNHPKSGAVSVAAALQCQPVGPHWCLCGTG